MQQVCALLLLTLTAGCAPQSSVLTAGVSAIRTSARTVDAESEKVFADINKASRDDVVQLLVLNGQRPSETLFNPVIPADTASRWSVAFDGVDKYLAALQDLVDAKRSVAITQDLQAIGTTLKGDAFGLKVPAGASETFARFGGAIVQASAEKKAQDVMRRTDPDFRALMSGLADLVSMPSGASRPGTLRSMVDVHWSSRIIAVEKAYGDLTQPTAEQRRTVLVQYGQALDSREVDRQRLERLRAALLAIGEAHSEAAKGSSGGTLFWLGQLNDFLNKARDEVKAGEK